MRMPRILLASLLILSFFLLMPITQSFAQDKLDCKWVKIKDKNGVAWKCVGKDCKRCMEMVLSKAQNQKNVCCVCRNTGDFIICRGTCCGCESMSGTGSMKPFGKPGMKPLRR